MAHSVNDWLEPITAGAVPTNLVTQMERLCILTNRAPHARRTYNYVVTMLDNYALLTHSWRVQPSNATFK
jgi:hypothetical protein